MPEPTIKDIKKLIKRCPKSPDSKTWNIHKYKNCMILWEFWMSDLGKKEGYYELLRPLFDNDNQYLGTQVLDNPKKDEYAELFYDIGSLIERRPLTTDKTQWTDEQKQVVEKLRESWIFAYWDGMGSEMEWEILKALFTENGEDYLGVLSSEHADWLGLTRTSPVQM